MRAMLITAALLAAMAAQAEPMGAVARFENATNVGQEKTGDAMLTRCVYETMGGYRFSIVRRGMCPFSVQVDPESGQVRG